MDISILDSIDWLMCIRSILLGAAIGIIVLLLPMGNAIIGALIVKGLVSTGIYDISNKEEIVLLSSTLISILLLNTIKEVIDPATSGNEDIVGIHIAGYHWECLEISVFQQIRELVETRIEGILGGIVIGFIIVNVLHITTPSIPISCLIIPLLIYKIIISNERIDTPTKIRSFMYLVLIATTVKLLNTLEYNEALLICLYSFFFLPSLIQSLLKVTEVKLYSRK